MSTIEKNTFSHFFKEDTDLVKDILNGTTKNKTPENTVIKKKLPRISIPANTVEEEHKTVWKNLRSFFRSGNNSVAFDKDLVPVMLSAYYTDKKIGSDYPIWVADEDFDGNGDFCCSLKELVENALSSIAPNEGDSLILKENIERIIHIGNELLAVNNQPQLFTTAIDKIIEQLKEQLDVTGDETAKFNNDLAALKKALPSCGALLPFTANTSYQLFEASMEATLNPVRKEFKNDIKQLICKLKDLLRVESEKTPDDKQGEKLSDSMDFMSDMVNFSQFSTILPDSGSEIMAKDRVNRIRKVVDSLESAQSIIDEKAYLLIDETLPLKDISNWNELFENKNIETYSSGTGCSQITAAFTMNIIEWEKLFIAKRIGELEFKNIYQPEVHDEYFENFNWENFSNKELHCCPHFALIANDTELFENEFNKLSELLTKGIPVNVVIVKNNDGTSKDGNTDKKGAKLDSHVELTSLALSHKNIYIAQTTSISPKGLFDGFTEGLASFSPALFNVLSANPKIHNQSYLWTSAMVESRNFPGFKYFGSVGTPWGNRFNIANNPQQDQKWPIHEALVKDHDGKDITLKIPFTYADYAILNPEYQSYFMPVSAAFWNDDLVLLSEYLETNIEENIGKVPFIWTMDENNELHKVAVSWPIVMACQERLDFWQFLQENTGINNYHVEQAIIRVKETLEKEHEQVIADLTQKHKEELIKVQDEETGKAMQKLTAVLLDLDTSSFVSTPSTNVSTIQPPTNNPVANNSEKEAPVAVKEVEEESLSLGEPWIETALCTSCNECININGSLFKYNADKMAYVADPKAGSFKEIVEAAENCPVKIIHPGAPLNSSEGDLDDLVKRAEKFN